MRRLRHAFPPSLVLAAALVGCADTGSAPAGLDVYRERLAVLEDRSFFQTIRIVDRHGSLLSTVAPEGRRVWIPLDEMPQVLRDAVIATEDQTFYVNTGVDPSALARAALQNAQAGETVSGASTITMQLVRMVAFDEGERYEQSLERKLREAHLAAELHERFTKDEILEAYLNVAYFGHQAYGVEAGANVYFGTSARRLSLAQASLLAGLLQAPTALDPLEHLDAAKARQRVVLNRMVDVGAITRAEADDAHSEDLGIERADESVRRARHFVDYVVERLPELVGPEVAARGGFTVTTTLDLPYQQALETIAAEHVARLREPHNLSDAGVVAVRPGSGEILAMVGGVDYDAVPNGQVNVTIRRRQPGSAFKPVVYATAFGQGWSPGSLLWDIPYSWPGAGGEPYTPTNYDGEYRGPIRLRSALGNSLNAATVGLTAQVGLEAIEEQARSLGIDLPAPVSEYGVSVGLGGAEVRLLDLTAAYAALAAGGQYAAPRSVLAVETFRGDELLHVPAEPPRQAVSSATAFMLSSILSDPEARTLAFSPGGPLEVSRPAAVKTGTSNDFRDNLTVGYTPYLALGVWAGNKDGSPMKDALGITGAAPIWHDGMELAFGSQDLMSTLAQGNSVEDSVEDGFQPPESVAFADVCRLTSLGLDGACQRYREVVSDEGGATDVAFNWYAVHQAATGPCSEAVGAGGGGQVMLSPPPVGDVGNQVRRWAAERGIPVAPPGCPDRAASSSGEGATAP